MTTLTPQQKLDFKQQLKDACITVMHERIKNIEQAIADAQEAAAGEEKSSAGDKYETQRAMAHLNSEMNTRQLNSARVELEALLPLNTGTLHTQVTTGAVVVCKQQVYFVALGLGRTVINGEKITLLSPQSPLAVLLHGNKPGHTFVINEAAEEIVEVF